jgi:NADPH:quinone reductase-like Zn-dependent oxidoreductase
MKAVRIAQHGDIGELRVSDIPAPSPGPGEVLVRVEASGINPSDLVSVRGGFPDAVVPRTVGRDFAGHVVAGPAGLIGVKVWGSGGDLGVTRDGTQAEFLVIPLDAVSRRPENLSADQAAAVGVPFVTAYLALVSRGAARPGEWAIVSGAAGAVGQAAIQLAHANGVHVVALVKDEAELWVTETRGVNAVADSERDDLETVVSAVTDGRGADVALNGVGASIFRSIMEALGPRGRQVVYSAVGGREFALDIIPFYRKNQTLFGLNTQTMDAIQCARVLDVLTPLFESGALQPPEIGERYPLVKAAEAYARAASGKAAKVVLEMTAR